MLNRVDTFMQGKIQKEMMKAERVTWLRKKFCQNKAKLGAEVHDVVEDFESMDGRKGFGMEEKGLGSGVR